MNINLISEYIIYNNIEFNNNFFNYYNNKWSKLSDYKNGMLQTNVYL